MHVLYIAAVLSLLSLSAAVPVPCEEKIRPLLLQDFSQISGKWIVIEVAANQEYNGIHKAAKSSWIEILPINKDIAIFNTANMINGECAYFTMNMTISDNNIRFIITHNNTVTLLPTCAGCLVMNGITYLEGPIIKTMHILGRPGKKLNDSELETFRNQLECVGLPPPIFHHDEQQELCLEKKSEESESKPDEDKSDGPERAASCHLPVVNGQ
ncbi:uncharacterized protein LOC133122550 [Conger conger]|uniref:uncharacterized protein LOC133122550 n=1 Tax=Conger conger TaxID=82655 RepID=UPI002A59D14F|nr:uncharacterized protein LOC133122550 [Conger conger]